MNQPISEDSDDHRARRNFVASVVTIVCGTVTGLIPLLAGGFAFLHPLFYRTKIPTSAQQGQSDRPEGMTRICALEALPINGSPQRFKVVGNLIDAWNFTMHQAIGAVFLQRVAEREVVVFNATCPHAGCSVSCDGRVFHCPCHNSSFELNGKKRESQSGRENPSPRDLDKLNIDQTKLAQGEVWIEFKNFHTGKKAPIEKT